MLLVPLDKIEIDLWKCFFLLPHWNAQITAVPKRLSELGSNNYWNVSMSEHKISSLKCSSQR